MLQALFLFSAISTLQFRPASGVFVILSILMANNQPFLAVELRCKPKQPNLIEAGPNGLVETASGIGEKVIEWAEGPDWLGEVAHSGIRVDRPVIEGKEKRLNLDQYLSLRQE